MTNWPETILMARAWFEGNPDGALTELEHRAQQEQATSASKDEQIRKLREALEEIIATEVLCPEGGHEAVAEIHCIARAALKEES